MSDTLTPTGWRFGAFRTNRFLPITEQLGACSRCAMEGRPLTQFEYCGTRGALCIPCLRALTNEAAQNWRLRPQRVIP